MNENNQTYAEAKRLWQIGFAIHWLHPKSKRPIESGWTTGPRKSWRELKENFRSGYNVGVRLGRPSAIATISGPGFLAVVDVDVKSADPRHRTEALTTARDLFRVCGVGSKPPTVTSGRGNGSCHYYCYTPHPFKTWNPAKSKDIVKVPMPSKKPSKKELAELTEEEIAQGIRLSPAWEISLYSDGRQVVLPPSIHPDTGKEYAWVKGVKTPNDLPFVTFPEESAMEATTAAGATTTNRVYAKDKVIDFVVDDVELAWLPIADKVREAIIHGTDVEDRSAYLLTACSALLGAKLTRDQILSVLTNPENFLGAATLEHAKTTNRFRAAQWVWKYTLKRVTEEKSAKAAFAAVAEIEELPPLSAEEAKAQEIEIMGERDWRQDLERTREGYYAGSLNNIKLIIVNVFGKDCIRFNEFAGSNEMWGSFPWLTEDKKEVHDIDISLLREWFADEWGFEPSENRVREVIATTGFGNSYHPVKTFLEALPKWDGKKRVDGLLERYIPCAGDNELRAVIGRRFMVALVKRIYEPGCQSDYLLILEGTQGMHKSSAFRTLIGEDWFTDATFNVNDKDAVMTIFSKWLIEFGELSSLDRTTAEHMKAFITRRTDRIRAPFERAARDFPRQCLFVGSTNKDEYLKDDTGNRRYWPFRVRAKCNVDLIARDREQLFAEALHLYHQGEVTYLPELSLVSKMESQQGAREMHDVLIDQVHEIIIRHEEQTGETMAGFPIRFFFDNYNLGVKNDAYGTARVATVLRKLGYKQSRPRENGRRLRIWSK